MSNTDVEPTTPDEGAVEETAPVVEEAPTPEVDVTEAKEAKPRKAAKKKAPAKPVEAKEFVVERSAFLDALGAATRAAGTEALSPGLSSVRLAFAKGALVVTGTDYQVAVTDRLAVEGRASATVHVPAKLLVALARAAEGSEMNLVVDHEELVVKAGEFVANVRSMDAESWAAPEMPAGDPVFLDAQALKTSIAVGGHATSKDEARPILCGVQFDCTGETLSIASTDSYRLGLARTIQPVFDRSVIVPRFAVAELARLIGKDAELVEVRLGAQGAMTGEMVGGQVVGFRVGAAMVVARLVEGEFPRYEQLIPAKFSHALRCERERLMTAIKRVAPFTGEARPVRLAIGKGQVVVSATDSDAGQASDTVEGEVSGGSLTVAFNGDFLVAALKATDAERVTLGLVDTQKPALVTVDGNVDGDLQLIMPVRLP